MHSRHQRSSFRGLTIIEGSASSIDQTTTNPNNRQHFTNKADRRRRSSSLAQSDQIRDIIAKTVAELNNNNKNSNTTSRSTAEDRLKQVLADVKEKGYSSERIFCTIGKASSESAAQDELIPKDTFVQGLKKLGCKCTDEEDLEYITDRFDKNQDGFISLVEFQQYCYNINSVGWKAEKQRLEAEKHSDGNCVEESRFDIREIKYASTDVYSTSKLYWKDNISVNITLRYCSDLDVITLQIQNAESKDDYTPLFIKKSDIAIDTSALESLAVQTSDAKTDEEKEQVRQQKHWEAYSSYLVTRLQLKEGACHLAKLTGDEFEKLDIPKPSNLLVPQHKRSERVSAADSVTAGKTIEDEFNNLSVKLTSESRSARNSRQDAQELSSVVESVLTEIYAEDLAAAAADLE